MGRASSPSETVIRVRWRERSDNEEHLLTFEDDEPGLEAANKFRGHLLHQGAMQVKLAREQKSWA